jgi:hypothetical protein
MINLNNSHRGGNFCLSKAGLAVGGTSSIARTNAPNGAGIDYCINGYVYHLTDADDNIALTGVAVADGYTSLVLVTINAAGTIAVIQSNSVLTTDLAAGNDQLVWPTPAANYVAIGAIKIAMDGAAFVGGTTGLDAAEATDTYYDLFALPSGPMTS